MLAHTSQPEQALLASTVVSSSLLGHLAHAAGACYVETLTGFKWIMHDSEQAAGQFIFGYEQALGLVSTPPTSFSRTARRGRGGADPRDHASAPPVAPDGVARGSVTEVDDAATGIRRTTDGHEVPWELPRSDVLVWRAGERIRVVERPSGTEPKLKVYLQVMRAVADRGGLTAAGRTGAGQLTRLESDVRALLLSVEPVTP